MCTLLCLCLIVIKTIIYGLQLAKPSKHTSVSSEMESELLNQSDDHTTQNNQHEETSEEKKESLDSSSRRRSSPSSRQRNYRKRSVSESPEKSPQRRSPEKSPSSCKRSRGNDISYLIHVLNADVKNLFGLASRSISVNLHVGVNFTLYYEKSKHRVPKNIEGLPFGLAVTRRY